MHSNSTDLQLRQYQQESLDHILQENTIVVLPTGAGKTLVAVKCIDRLRMKAREENGPGCDRVMFIVPSVALVDQQADYCQKYCAERTRVTRLSSSEKIGWGKKQWDECLQDNDVLVGTPEIFSRALTKHAYISLRSFCFLVFDECHHAVGNHPMAAICKDALWSYMESSNAIRVAGFTASPSKESLEQTEERMETTIFLLEQALQSKIFSPDVPEEFRGVSAREQSFHHVDVPAEHVAAVECGRFAERWLQDLITNCDELGKIKDVPRVLNRLRNVFDQLWKTGFLFAVEHNVIPQLQAKIRQLLAYTQDAPERRIEAETLQAGLPKLKDIITSAVANFENRAQKECSSWSSLPKYSAKVFEVFKILQNELVTVTGAQPVQARCLIFVHETMLPRPLADVLNEHIKSKGLAFCAGAVCGVNAMGEEDRRSAIERFRSGETTILVSSSALEEGLDVPECQILMRFDKFNTVQSQIQGAGRARHQDAKVFYFENDPLKTQRAAKRMLAIAQDPQIQPREEDQELVRQEHLNKRARLEGKHPFGGGDDSAEVSVYNCRDVVYAYCAKVLKDSFVTESLYQWAEGEHAQLLCVTYPTPDGPKKIEKEQVDAYWNGVSMADVFDPVRCKRYGSRDKEELCFLFIVARHLREGNYLDGHNHPTVRAREMTLKRCPQPERVVNLTITNKFPKRGSSQGLPNPKGALMEWCQKTWRGTPLDQAIKYDTKETPGGFRSTVCLFKLKLRFEGDVCKSKKLAEVSASEKALQHEDVG